MRNPERQSAITNVVLSSTEKINRACSQYAHGKMDAGEFVRHLDFCIDSLVSYRNILREEKIDNVKKSVQSQVHSTITKNGRPFSDYKEKMWYGENESPINPNYRQ